MLHFGERFSSSSFAPQLPCLSCLIHPANSALLSGSFFLQSFSSLCDVYSILLFHSGGGIGGLTLAFALSKSPDISVDVYEAASKFTEIGAGISLWWRTRQVLKSLGLEEDVIRLLPFRPSQDRGELDLRRLYETLESCSAVLATSKSRSARRPCYGGIIFSRFDLFSLWSTQCTHYGTFPFVQVN